MTWTRLLGTWFLLAVLMPINGALREFGFKRIMADRTAEWLSALSGIVLILVTTRLLFRIPAGTSHGRLALWALVLVALTVAYEFGIGLASGRTLRELAANYALWDGQVWPLVLIALAATPWIWRGR